MPDVAMCMNKECEFRGNCYRYLAIPNTWQSYGDFKPINGKCDHLWEIDRHKDIRTLEEIEDNE